MNKYILVTGGAGYIGSHTVHYLIKDGMRPESIIVFDNLTNGNRNHLPEEVVFIKGDLREKDQINITIVQKRIFKT